MTKFLRQIIDEMNRLSLEEIKDPGIEEVKPEEQIVGVLPEGLRRLWGLKSLYHQKVRTTSQAVVHRAADFIGEPDKIRDPIDEESLGLLRANQLARDQFFAIHDLFWASLRTEFAATVGKDLELRPGWQVAVFSPKMSEEEEIFSFGGFIFPPFPTPN